MRIEFCAQAKKDRVVIDVPQAQLRWEAANVVAYETTTNKIAAVGMTAEDMRKAAPEEWEKYIPFTGFVYPFDVEQFNTFYAYCFLRHYTYLVMEKLRKGLSGILFLFDTFTFHLQIDGYEKLPASTRQEFEYTILKSSFPKVHALNINGHTPKFEADFLKTKRRIERREQISEWTLKFCFCLWLVIPFSLAWMAFPEAYKNKPLAGIEVLLALAIILMAGAVIIYLSLILGLYTWVFVMRLFLSQKHMKELMLGANLGIHKRIIGRIINRFLSEPL